MDQDTRIKVESAVLRALLVHLRERTDVQNRDLMDLAGFCRNCLAKWYKASAQEYGMDITYEEAREIIYGMPYMTWKEYYQIQENQEK